MINLPNEDKPRERMIKNGANVLSNQELLAVVLRTGVKGKNVLSLARDVLNLYPNLEMYKNITIEELSKVEGIGKIKASEIVAAIEFGKRIALAENKPSLKVNSSEDIGEYLAKLIGNYKQEHVILVCLNTKNEIINIKEVYIGGLSESVIHPRELYNIAIRVAAAKIIIAHNHPSGNLCASKADLNFTKRLINSGKLLGIPLMDHLIVNNKNYLSIRAKYKIFI